MTGFKDVVLCSAKCARRIKALIHSQRVHSGLAEHQPCSYREVSRPSCAYHAVMAFVGHSLLATLFPDILLLILVPAECDVCVLCPARSLHDVEGDAEFLTDQPVAVPAELVKHLSQNARVSFHIPHLLDRGVRRLQRHRLRCRELSLVRAFVARRRCAVLFLGLHDGVLDLLLGVSQHRKHSVRVSDYGRESLNASLCVSL